MIKDRNSTPADEKFAQARLDLLQKLRTAQDKQVKQSTVGSPASCFNQIPETDDEINAALQGVDVNALESLQSGLPDGSKVLGSLGEAFGNTADTTTVGLSKVAFQQLPLRPLSTLLFGGGSGRGGELFSSLVSGPTVGITGKANGNMGNSGRDLVGQHGPEYVGIRGSSNVTPKHKLASVCGGAEGSQTAA